MLRAAPTDPATPDSFDTVLGLISDADTVYWSEAAPRSGIDEIGPPSPPGRLHAVPKAGGPELVLADLTNNLYIHTNTGNLLAIAKPE